LPDGRVGFHLDIIVSGDGHYRDDLICAIVNNH
jgi:hypothetical protein